MTASGTLAAALAERQILRYATYAWDAESATYYCSARTYDPASAQFISKDPAKADGEESAYQYCGGDPVGRVDQAGEAWIAVGGGAHAYGAAAAGAASHVRTRYPGTTVWHLEQWLRRGMLATAVWGAMTLRPRLWYAHSARGKGRAEAKKQNREVKERKRQKGNFRKQDKYRNPKEPKSHSPSKKHKGGKVQKYK